MNKIHLLALAGIPGLLFLSHHWAKAVEIETLQAKLAVSSPTSKNKIYGTGVGPKPGANVPPPVLPRAGTPVSKSASHTVTVIRRKAEEKERQKQVRIRELDAQIVARKQQEAANRQQWATAQVKPKPAPVPKPQRVTTAPQRRPQPSATRPQRVATTPRRQTQSVTTASQRRPQRVAAKPQRQTQSVTTASQRRPQPSVTRPKRVATTPRRQTQPVTTTQSRPIVKPQPQRVATASLAPKPLASAVETKQLAKKLELEKVSFMCGKDDSVPATFEKKEGKEGLPVILWSSNFFTEAGYDPQTRCQQVSARLETYKNNDELSYITTGKINGQPVVCVTSQEKGSCGEGISVHNGLLFTLKPNESPQERLEQLFAVLHVTEESPLKSLKE
ncbi:MAG: hypothetical protein F6K36_03970 [Symploca sp. SIO3C6]|nr:hypothetical protein [Symploca sp. SIO3C6]